MWLSGATSVTFLALALLAAVRRTRHPLALRLALLSAGLFAYDLAETLSVLTGLRAWDFLGNAAASLTAIPTLDLFVGFLGMTHQVRPLRRAATAYFPLLAGVVAAPLFAPRLAFVYESGLWAIAMLAGLIPVFSVVAALLVRRLRQERGAERVRIQLLGGALLLGLGSVLYDLGGVAGLALPRISHVGLLLSSLLLAALVLESRIIEGVRAATVINVALVATLAVVGQVVVVAWAGDRTAFLLFGTSIVLVLAVVAIVPLLRGLSEQRARTEQLTTLGRFAEQMAHDIRNPLAAIKGAAQFLEEEHREGRPLDAHADMLAIIVERVDRIERFVADYQRMGRVEPVLAEVKVAAVVGAAARVVDALGEGRVEARTTMEQDDIVIMADADLLVFALENLVRNACEAMPDGGVVQVSVGRRGDERLAIVVEDTGSGMDARQKERALGGLFSTKEGGTGLGLSFVRRVVEAHGGRLVVSSEVGRGTKVTMDLPIDGASTRPG